MKLIDADVFESVLDFADADVCEEFPDDYCEFGFSRERIRKLLRDIPTVDAVPVVRCRECKKHENSAFYPDMVFCTRHGIYMRTDGFCSCGDWKCNTTRKEGAD